MKILVLGLILFLGACAPSANVRRINVETEVGERSFYPNQTGLKWEYLEQGERDDTPRFTKEISGPVSIEGKLYTLTRLYGRGLDSKFFELYTDTGVAVAREDRPGTILTYNPPMKTLPNPSDMQVGHKWNGSSDVSIYYTDDPGKSKSLSIDYTYHILDTRTVTINDKTFDIFVISLEASQTFDGKIERVSQEIWYSPFFGEVKTRFNLFVSNTNFDF